MTYNVQLGNGGYLGWKLLERSAEKQRATFENSKQVQLSRDYFLEKLPTVKSADELISDYKLLSVALRAFGLDADIGNKAFIKKVIDSDLGDEKSLVNRLTDKRYLNFNKALGLSSTEENSTSRLSTDEILNLYVSRSFEKNIGERHPEIELALNFRRELPAIITSSSSDTTKWYQIISSKPLRKVFEGALGLSTSFSSFPIERQAAELSKRLEKLIGVPISKINTSGLDKLIKNYLVRSSAMETSASPYSVALKILRKS